MTRTLFWVVAASVALAACDNKPSAGQASPPTLTADVRSADSDRAVRGQALYQEHCAACHGAHAEGAPNWEKPGPDGKYPAPPLNGTAHDWHHPQAVLVKTIKEGTVRLGGNMPAWSGKLSDGDVEAVIVWFQSRWPADVYKNWVLMDEKARRGQGGH